MYVLTGLEEVDSPKEPEGINHKDPPTQSHFANFAYTVDSNFAFLNDRAGWDLHRAIFVSVMA
jgi:hypothetical protein